MSNGFTATIFVLEWNIVTLESSKLFGQLDPKEQQGLRRIAQERQFAPGQEIFRESDPGDGLYIVKDGLVEISVVFGQEARHVFSQVGPGDMFGEMAVVEDKPRSASAVARQPSTVYFISRTELLALIERSPALALALLREISQRLREFNRQHLREVLQAERLAVIGRFARSIVHDLKNPLNTIGLSAEMAIMERATPELRKRAQTSIRTSIDRISEMVGEILEFTQSSSTEFVLAPMDYREYVGQLLEELRPEAALKSVTLECAAPPPDTALLLNPKRLRRVFCNLIHNATEAMPEGGHIRLRFQQTPGEISTEIEDSGPGIPAEMAGRLFEPFATHGKAHGTGLGLSICKRIIEDHKGWIAARSEPGRGAVFAFGLPLPLQ
jgi:signal transduction histidine kinase